MVIEMKIICHGYI